MGANASTNSSHVLTFGSSSKVKAHLEASKETNKLIVIDFMAKWCGPCLDIEKIIEQYAAKYTNVEFIKIDVDKLERVADEFQVQKLPTFKLMKNGEVVAELTGAEEEELEKLIEQHQS